MIIARFLSHWTFITVKTSGGVSDHAVKLINLVSIHYKTIRFVLPTYYVDEARRLVAAGYSTVRSKTRSEAIASGRRQPPGLSCEECRRRKARCDRVRPQCGTCAEMDIICVFVDKRPQRGPKKGQLNALRSRVAPLERQLTSQLGSFEAPTVKIGPNTTISWLSVFNDMEQDMNMNVDINLSDMAESEEKMPETAGFVSMIPDLIPIGIERQDDKLLSPENLA
ncbi:hypothetical protein K449DRAFT_400033 [Hypoxylon sp. EC38]|nr:hypothetical protein K449DRAFT_400033 [Hypoxylon sp. EC38]